MKTISLRELHNNTGKWISQAENEIEIIVTNRGKPVASLSSLKNRPPKTVDWAKRKLVPGYAAYLKSGMLTTDSTPGISADRTSRDNSVAGIEE